jgi:cytochrome c oxidase subunit III
MSRPMIDVRSLPEYAFGNRGLLWWATFGLIAVEGTMFALLLTSYLYIKGRNPDWPPGFFPPDLIWGTLNTGVLLASLLPNQLAKVAAERLDLRKTRRWLTVAIAFAVAFNVIRIFEFRSLNVWWDSNAYGSVVWTLLGFHTAHVLTDLLDTLVIAMLLFTGPLKEKHFVDVSENSFYWYFVVLSWMPIYVMLYVVPRYF